MQLASPTPGGIPMQYAQVNGVGPVISEPITTTPLLCGNTSAPTVMYGAISPLYYSPTGVTSLKPFVFGASAANPTVQAFAQGALTSLTGSTMRVLGDPALVCYGLDANGVHGPTPGVLRDQFEGVNYSPTLHTQFNSSVVLNVFHVPTSSTDFYGYTIDVSIPAVPAGVTCSPAATDCNFALLEGFDTSIFDTSANAGNTAGWCLASAGATSCPGSASAGGINLNYTTFNTNGLPSLAAGGAPTTFHFVVKRFFRSGVTALPTGGPVALAALFSPFDMDENFIGDNVAVGYGNAPPAVVQTGDVWTVFSGKLGSLAENTYSGDLTFNITDADTPESGGQNLTAAVTLNLAGISLPIGATCTAISGPGVSNRQCTTGVNFADPNWWNAYVTPDFQGQFNAFATDPGGVAASASIVVTDPLGKSSAPVSVPLHVQSTVNSAPVVAFGGAMPSNPDVNQGGTSYPTYSCSVAANNCGGTFNVVELNGVISALPGPAAAFDELASQTTDVNSVVCGQSGEQGAIFQNQPVATLSGPGSFDLVFQLASPLVTGSSLCTVSITDKMAVFPAGESAQVAAKQFRIVVNP